MAERALTREEIAAGVAKTNAEARQAEANARLADANAELAAASAAEKLAAAREHDVDARARATEEEHTKLLIEHSGVENRIAHIALAKCEREESFAKVSDLYHKVYNFDSDVNERSVKACINTLTAWTRQQESCDITIYLNSPGGSILDGFSLIDFLLDLRVRGHKITTVALGWAASMAAVILQAGDERVMGRNAFLLIHEGSLGVVGNYGEVEDRMRLVEKMHQNIWELFAGRAQPINPKTTVAYLKKLAKRTDVSLNSTEALALGLVDSVR
jgi:ATP-dependent protease ClpP protease subunit